MSMQDFINGLSPEQKAEFARILVSNDGQDPIRKDIQQDVESSGKDGVVINADFSVTRPDGEGKRAKVKGGKNTWTDDGVEAKDVVTPEFVSVPRKRQPPVKLDYKCHVCSKMFKSEPSLIYGEFPRCNKCGGS